MSFSPHVTVAALIKKDDRYLMVEEGDPNASVFNQPAGHIEEGETPFNACVREILEETGWQAEPQHLIGVYILNLPEQNKVYYRFGFRAAALEQVTDRLDKDIIACHWLTLKEIQALNDQQRLRSDLVLQLIEDDLNGKAYPLTLIHGG
ncbi:MAG: NUDIX hydrolase [Nitrincola sp.]|nr:NUDIX hydrolase [Nitrincola sp.]